MPRQFDSIEEWSFDSHDWLRATDLDTAYDAPIHDWDEMAQRELEDDAMTNQTTSRRENGVERTDPSAAA